LKAALAALGLRQQGIDGLPGDHRNDRRHESDYRSPPRLTLLSSRL
jgi:hypothetical protein